MSDISRVSGASIGNVGADLQAEKIYKTNKTTGDSSIKATTQDGDKVMFSQEALNAAQNSQEIARLTQLAKALPDQTDEARISDIASKVERGDYLTPDVAQNTAKKILESMEEI
jgi:hypothetical protein